MLNLEEQIIEVETDIYRILNANNGDDMLDIECRSEIPTGSHFPQRVCEPKFLTEARQENNRDAVTGTDDLLTPDALRDEVAAEFEKLNAVYARLLEEDEIFAEIVGILGALQARLAQF